MATQAEPFLGLDFGTSTTLLARTRGASGVEVMPLGKAEAWLPSIVGVRRRGDADIVGEEAELLPATQVFRSVKRAITFDEPFARILLPDGELVRKADDIAAGIVGEALRRADWAKAKRKYAGARAGCPAMWDREQRSRFLAILSGAGLEVEPSELIDEPIAAAVAWVNKRRVAHGERVTGRLVVFDYGGGTLDIAVCEVQWAADLPEITVLSCLGVPKAGDILDDSLLSYVREQMKDDPRYEGTPVQDAAIRREVRFAKEALSTASETVLRLDEYGLPSLPLTRAELEREFRPQLHEALGSITGALRESRLREKNPPSPVELRALDEHALDGTVDFVLLAGGMSRVPVVADALQSRFSGARVETVEGSGDGGVQNSQHLVVAGLIHDPTAYDRLNLHRPGFNLRVEWRRGRDPWGGETMYHAHTSLYSAADISSGNFSPNHRSEFRVPHDVRASEARLVVTSQTGELLTLLLDGKVHDSLPMSRIFGGSDLSLNLYVTGKILLKVNGHEENFSLGAGELRMERWQVIRGSGSARRQVVLERRIADATWTNQSHPHK